LPSISWSAPQSCCFEIHIWYSFGNSIFFHSLYTDNPSSNLFAHILVLQGCYKITMSMNIHTMSLKRSLIYRLYEPDMTLTGWLKYRLFQLLVFRCS
jgi:hypothetical protein